MTAASGQRDNYSDGLKKEKSICLSIPFVFSPTNNNNCPATTSFFLSFFLSFLLSNALTRKSDGKKDFADERRRRGQEDETEMLKRGGDERLR